ncbi:phosphotransferase [Actinophytocola sediminis]
MMTGHGGNRLDWALVPERVRAAIGLGAGAPVVEAVSQPGGFSPGLAARLLLADGRRVFAKAVGVERNATSVRMYREEAVIAAGLPASVGAPRLLWTADIGDWVALVFDDVAGHSPALPWRADEWARVHAAVVELAAIPAPAVVGPLSPEKFQSWRLLAADEELLDRVDPWVRAHLDRLVELEGDWAAGAAGDRLMHCDLRADNILLTEDRVLFVDWPHARAAAPWLDLVFMLPCVAMQGGPDPVEVWRTSPLSAGADPAAVDAALAAITGYFTHSALLPPPTGLPALREFQRRQGEPALRWLRARLS